MRASYTDLLKASEVGVVGVEVWVAGVGDSGWPREGCDGDRVVSVALLVAAYGWCDDDDDEEEEGDDEEEEKNDAEFSKKVRSRRPGTSSVVQMLSLLLMLVPGVQVGKLVYGCY